MKLIQWPEVPKGKSPRLAFIQQFSHDFCPVYSALRLQLQAPFIPHSLVESTMGHICVGDAVGYLLTETVGRGETAAKTGQGIDSVNELAFDLYFRHVCC